MTEATYQWKRMAFKKNKVWIAVHKDGSVVEKNGKVLMKYQQGQDYEYWVHKDSIKPLSTLDAVKNKPPAAYKATSPNADGTTSKKDPAAESPEKISCENAVCLFTDGASSGNPGPAGIGVLLRYENREKEISKYIGVATNNIAELKAIEAGLNQIKNNRLPVRVFTDSSYAFGVLYKGWKAKENKEIVAQIRNMMTRFQDLKFIKVKGHAGHKGNERADFLATSAIKKAAPKQP